MHEMHGHGHRFSDVERLRSPERVKRLEISRVVDLALEDVTVQTVLDIGAGTGLFAEAFSQRGRSVTGIDVSPVMLEAARRYVPDGVFQQAAAESLPFPAHSFDLVFMGLVLHETDDLLKALQEAHRVAVRRLAVLEWPYVLQDFGPGLEERLAPEQIQALARQAGFSRCVVTPLEQLVLYRCDEGHPDDAG